MKYIMKYIGASISGGLLIVFAACSPANGPDRGSETPENILVGADRDEHNCIASAGYVWSELSGACVRLFEAGVLLESAEYSESTSNAYLIEDPEGQRLELFDHKSAAAVQLFKTQKDQWEDTAQNHIIKLERPAQYTVYKDSERIYFENQFTPNPLNAAQYESAPDRDNNDEALNESGILVSVEDGAYPFYALTIEFPKNQARLSFTLNAEEVQVDIAALTDSTGEYISFDYTSDLEPMVMELELESGFVMDTENRHDLRAYKTARGLMGGAVLTMGDLPGTFFLEDAEGRRSYFEEYITEDMMAGLGRDVIVYYEMRSRNIITNIDLNPGSE